MRSTFVKLNPQLKKYYLVLIVSLVFSFAIQMILNSLGVNPMISVSIVIAVFLILPFMMRRRYMNNMRGYGGDSGTGGGFFGMNSSGTGVRYVCLVCSNKHKGGTCPRCGSKMQRADF